MQKKLIALAIAGFAAAPAFAQVTVYGVASVALERVEGETDVAIVPGTVSTPTVDLRARQRVASNSSILGFRGTEDLGGGLNAIFQIESGVGLDGNSATLGTTRDSFVGLQSANLGTLKLGFNSNPYRRLQSATDLSPGATSIANIGAMYGELGGIKHGLDDRISNSVAYDSPVFAGVQIQAIYGANEARTAAKSDGIFGAGVVYNNGPLMVALTGERRNDAAAFTAANGFSADTKLSGTRLGAKYVIGPVTLVALYDKVKLEELSATGSDRTERDSVGAGVAYTAGAHNVFVQYARASDLESDGVKEEQTGANQIAVGYNYVLSKRTQVTTYYSRISNDDNVAYDFYVNGVGAAAPTASAASLQAGATFKGFGLGLRHSF